jgi:hypothetical protein
MDDIRGHLHMPSIAQHFDRGLIWQVTITTFQVSHGDLIAGVFSLLHPAGNASILT